MANNLIFSNLYESRNRKFVEFCIVSDLHIGADEEKLGRSLSTSSRQDYVFADNKIRSALSGEAHTLKRFCQKIISTGKSGLFDDNLHKLIFLGDLINGECGYFSSYHSTAYKMLLSSILPWIHTGNIIYITGNHDKDAKFYSNMTGFPRQSIIEGEYEDSGVIFTHGHKFDFLCDGTGFLGKMGDFASKFVTKLCNPNVEDLLRGREYYYVHDQSNKTRDQSDRAKGLSPQSDMSDWSIESRRVAKGAMSRIQKESKFHTIVCGHTHQSPVRLDFGEKHYINSGKFARDGFLNVVCREVSADFGAWELVEYK